MAEGMAVHELSAANKFEPKPPEKYALDRLGVGKVSLKIVMAQNTEHIIEPVVSSRARSVASYMRLA